MFGIDGPEFIVIILVLIVVIGPKDLPKMLRAFGKATARMRTTANEFRRQFDDAMREAELDDLQKTMSDVRDLDPRKSLTKVFDPIRDVANDVRSSLDIQGNMTALDKANASNTVVEIDHANIDPDMAMEKNDIVAPKTTSALDAMKEAAPILDDAPLNVAEKSVVKTTKPQIKPVKKTVAKKTSSKPIAAAAVKTKTPVLKQSAVQKTSPKKAGDDIEPIAPKQNKTKVSTSKLNVKTTKSVNTDKNRNKSS